MPCFRPRWLLCALLLTSCAPLPTYADAQATAAASGCWPDGFPTPRALTVTPAGGTPPTPDLALTATSGPAPTRLPTTTALPRCTPLPDATAVPWPTAIPNPPPYPTMAARPWQTGGDLQTTLHLPGNVLALDLAAHPTEDWVAVAGVAWSGTQDPDRVMVSVLSPTTRSWGVARQVDLGPARIGRYTRTVAIAITGDRAVHVVWSMSDPDFSDGDPPSGTWLSSSRDLGAHWSPPEQIARGCRGVSDLLGTPDGALAVLLTCETGPQTAQPVLLVRDPAGRWQTPERLPAPVWVYSEGALALSGVGAEQRIVGLMLAGAGDLPVAYLFARPLVGASTLQRIAIVRPDGQPAGLRMSAPRAVAFARPLPDGRQQAGVSFSWSAVESGLALVLGLTSLDGGRSWGPVEPIVDMGDAPAAILSAPLAYDPSAARLVAIWSCCGDARWQVVPATHYARWSAPGSGAWWLPAPDDVPLVLGSRVAASTVAAQSANSRQVWLAWVEQQQQIVVRSLTLSQVVPAGQYPTPTLHGGR